MKEKGRMIKFLVMRIKEGFPEEVAFKQKLTEEAVKKTKVWWGERLGREEEEECN